VLIGDKLLVIEAWRPCAAEETDSLCKYVELLARNRVDWRLVTKDDPARFTAQFSSVPGDFATGFIFFLELLIWLRVMIPVCVQSVLRGKKEKKAKKVNTKKEGQDEGDER